MASKPLIEDYLNKEDIEALKEWMSGVLATKKRCNTLIAIRNKLPHFVKCDPNTIVYRGVNIQDTTSFLRDLVSGKATTGNTSICASWSLDAAIAREFTINWAQQSSSSILGIVMARKIKNDCILSVEELSQFDWTNYNKNVWRQVKDFGLHKEVLLQNTNFIVFDDIIEYEFHDIWGLGRDLFDRYIEEIADHYDGFGSGIKYLRLGRNLARGSKFRIYFVR